MFTSRVLTGFLKGNTQLSAKSSEVSMTLKRLGTTGAASVLHTLHKLV